MLETPQGVSRWTFRAGGWPIQIDLDETVLEMRVYMGRQVVATGRVAAAVMSALLGRTPIDTGGAVQADDCIAALREIIGDGAAISPTVTTSPTPSRQRPVAGSWAPFTEGDIQAPSSWSRRHRLTQEHPGPVAPFREGDGQVQSL